ncbi:HYR domain-containing protein [Flavobacterium panacagri]|uniref:HYR domain-containing protein n=1 Tax=Flavobacterium panacagri TaxID=3034146 RepID=UPI0025A597E0|nr:HYR domain-containing protein [Flavobacterium panacagri]
MRNFTFNWFNLLKPNFIVLFFFLISCSASAQFYSKHYIAPAPWQYFSKANEIVIATNSTSTVNVSISKSNGTLIANLTTVKGTPAVYRFAGLPKNAPAYAFNTILNSAGLIISGNAPVSVNLRNIASDALGSDGSDKDIKGNAALTSFGDAGIGIRYRIGYYRDGSLGNFNNYGDQRPIYSVMAISNGTTIKLNNAVITTLDAGQSYLFTAPMGSLVETSNPTVMNTSAAIDTPNGCGDGAYNQIPPEAVLGTEYFIERGKGNDTAEQTTVVATKPNTVLTIDTFSATGALTATVNKTLVNAGDFYTFKNGVSGTNFSASRVFATNNVAVYSGTARDCEVDVYTIAPVSQCGGSNFIETAKFRNYGVDALPYFGYVLLKDASEKVYINGVDIETKPGIAARHQLGNTGWYLINFEDNQIGSPDILSLSSLAKLTVSIVQQGGGFTMAGFFSNFAVQPADPTFTYVSGGGCTNNTATLTTPTGFAPYQWYLNGVAISGANSETYTATKTGSYSVASTLTCGAQTQSKPVSVTLCTDLGVTKTVDNATPCVGSNVEFTVKLSNLGVNNATGVSINDLLPSGYTFASSTQTVGSYNATTGVWSIGDVNGGVVETLKITAKVNASGVYTNTAALPGTTTDSNSNNNSASVSTNPNPLPTASITGTLTACLTTTLTAVTNAASPTYVWYKNNAVISGQTSSSLVVNSDGDYKVKVTNSSTGCETTSTASTVKVSDTDKPVKPVLADITAQCSATVTAPTTTDNCAGTVTGTTTSPLTYTAQGTYSITWSFNDGNGNVETAIQKVIIKDTQKPAITCPTAVVVSADANSCVATGVNLGTPTTSDNCSGAVTVTNNAPSSFPIGNTTVTWTATDAAGNTQTCTQTVTVNDTQKPAITCPSAVVVSADADSCSATGVSLGTPTTSDNCSGAVTVTNNAPSSFPIGNTTVTLTATDAAGNTQTCTQTVTVNDTQKPAITCPSAVVVSADADSCSATGVSLGTPTTSDNCSGAVTVTNNAPSSFPIGNTTVTWTATDAAGNKQTCTQTVTVNDTQKPAITCPSAVVVSADADSCSATGVSLGTPTTSDNCNGTVTVTNNAPSSFPIGNTTVTWTATDAAGNKQTCTQTVTVNDTQKPAITCPSAVVVSADADSCSATGVSLGTPTTSDNCNGTVTVTNNAPSSFPIGNTTVTWTATDAAGNKQTCTQTVTVNDTQKPAITCPSAVVVSADADSCSATGVSLGTPTTSDNCNGIVTVTNNAPSSFPIGNTTVTWTATDAAGNKQTCTQTVTVNDTQKPAITCPSAVVVSADADSCSATGVSLGTPTTSDNCNGTVTVTNNAPSSFPIGNTTVTWTATDAAGNKQTCTQIVKVVGPIKPNNDVVSINGYPGGTAVSDVLANDFLNCKAVVRSEVDLTLASSLPSVLTFDTTTGKVTVKPNTPAGTYSFDYKICEVANTSNCNTATVEIKVTAPAILAVKEDLGPINGTIGGTTTSLIASDKLNGVQAVIGSNPGQVTLTAANVPAGFTVNADGTITVSKGVKKGNYDIEYTICDNNNITTNCSTATSTVTVTAADLVANLDAAGSVIGGNSSQALINVFDNDTKNGAKLDPSEVKLTPGTDPKGFLTIDSDGNAILGANAPAGNYELTYEICELFNPGNCSTNKVQVTVTAPAILAVKEDLGPINGTIGGTTTSLIASDKLNGVQAVIGSNPGQVTLTAANVPAGFTVNAAGTITVSKGVKKGNYDIEYTICDNNNITTNCSTATSTVTVTAADLVANLDAAGSVIGGNSSQTLINVFDNDTKNGAKLDPSEVKLTPGTDPKGFLTIDADGNAILGANAPAGNYELTYEICELFNPGNCSTNNVQVTVTAPAILAVKEDLGPINGTIGGTTTSLIASDKLNGVQAVIGSNPGQVTLTAANVPAGFTVNADGTVTVSKGVKKGNYDIEYTICDNNNITTNCSTATSTVAVTAADLVANLDAAGSVIGGNSSQTLINVFDNDTKNGAKLDPSEVKLTPGTDPKGFLTIDADGNAILGANAPAGNYELTYEICELFNPGNCSTNKVQVTVTAPVILAVAETLTPSINGSIGGTTSNSVIENDTLNGNPVVIGTQNGQVKLTAVNVPAGLTLNTDGTVTVAVNTPSGIYNIEYSICEITNPLNCDTAISKVAVNNGTLVANSDALSSVKPSNASQTLGGNVFDNDTKNGQPLNPLDVTLTTSTQDPKGYLALNPDGTVILGANPPAGDYELTYTICEKLNPENCSSNKVRVTVDVFVIDAIEETLTPSINGSIGGTTTNSVVDNDTLNGNPVVIGIQNGQVKLSAVNVPAGLTLNADGSVTVAVNTPSGIYNIEYSICEITNPSNCDSAISKVAVNNGVLIANADNIPSVKVSNTAKNLGFNVFTNDTENGIALNPSDVNLTITTPDPKGYLTVNSDGTVTLGSNAPAGDYELTYTICEKLNPGNCSSNTVRLTVESNLVANLDSVPATVGINTQQTLINVFANDTKDGNSLVPSDVILTTTVADPKGYLTVDANGNAILAPNAPAGDYELTYSICDKLNASNCSTNMVKVTVTAPIMNSIIANNDADGPIDVKKGMNASINIFANDLLNGVKPSPSDIILTTTVANPHITLNADGAISIAPNTPDGTYEVTYQICEAANTSNCSQPAVVKITVVNSADPAGPPASNQISLGDDTNISVDGINGDLEFINVLGNDLINGQPINPAAVVIKPLTIDNYFEWNADGTVSVKPNTPGKTYTLTYQVCEKADPLNCSTAVLTVFVEVPAIAVVKAATFNDENNSGFANAGETITYKFTLTNTGNVPLTGVIINDPLPGVKVSGQAIDLAVNESNETNFTAIYKITQEDINRGSVTNQAIAKGSSLRGVAVEDQSDDSSNNGDNPTVLDLNGCSIKVLKAFSPNGDSKNERFYIRGIECYPDNTVEIYNRWGVLVFNIDQYNNSDRAFIGYSNGRSTVKQTEGLPVGTYFYILKYKDSAKNPHQESGYLYINK